MTRRPLNVPSYTARMPVRNVVVDTWRGAKAAAAHVIARNWNRPVLAGAAAQANRYLRMWGNDDNHLARNGEAEVLARLADELHVVVDVGANRGDWAAAVLAVRPGAVVHCFEPVPEQVAELRRRFANGEVTVHAVALSDRSGTADIVLDADHSMNSLVRRPATANAAVTAVAMARGDDECAAAGVDAVDLLKVDTEGFDLHVLRGFSQMLGAGAIAAVQFEFNAMSVFSRTVLLDFYELLEPLGYAIGKIHPNGVDFRPYDLDLENWTGPNCLAVRRDRIDLIDRVRIRSKRAR